MNIISTITNNYTLASLAQKPALKYYYYDTAYYNLGSNINQQFLEYFLSLLFAKVLMSSFKLKQVETAYDFMIFWFFRWAIHLLIINLITSLLEHLASGRTLWSCRYERMGKQCSWEDLPLEYFLPQCKMHAWPVVIFACVIVGFFWNLCPWLGNLQCSPLAPMWIHCHFAAGPTYLVSLTS